MGRSIPSVTFSQFSPSFLPAHYFGENGGCLLMTEVVGLGEFQELLRIVLWAVVAHKGLGYPISGKDCFDDTGRRGRF